MSAEHTHLLDFAGFVGDWIVHDCLECPARRYSHPDRATFWKIREDKQEGLATLNPSVSGRAHD
ncbi:hypothetical protein LCGC14_2451760 [marine sediment metagenome]|uniref:Uncharacterized protein n=1 Tax=marine sediment metagenome TaxID=412755 RepID=A0A0F9BGC6_9ZZZZ